MNIKYSDHFNLKKPKTPQSEAAYGAKQNHAGGYSFEIDLWQKLDRFLILGTEGGTYYVSERALTRESAKNVQLCIETDGLRVAKQIAAISQSGRAPKNDPALFALAMCASLGDEKARSEALKNLPLVARTASHLFLFAEYVTAFRGWGRGLKKSIGKWYNEKESEALVYQLIKYQERNGWSHRDLLRLSHPKPATSEHRTLYRWACSCGEEKMQEDAIQSFGQIKAMHRLNQGAHLEEAVELITTHRLPREVIPTEFLNHSEVWEALLTEMPITAMIRNLGKMTKVGLLQELSYGENFVVEKLGNTELLKKARVHPLTILVALMTYSQGAGLRGKLAWRPSKRITESLESAFYASFDHVAPTHKRLMIGVDVSGSMFWGNLAGSPMTPGDAAAALSLVTKATEESCVIKAFSYEFVDLSISKTMRFQEVISLMRAKGFGDTDCALPMVFAKKNKLEVDAFLILTDSETWAGDIYPSEALRDYRDASGIDAKLVVCGMVGNRFSIADPNDKGMLDVVGFDTSTPTVISDFIRD
ncbi:MAG: TROVE domain-containing protein [Chlamydiia bacterium]|nr:TROVE domain-containing protein [Chlamydiia bacterium]